METSREKPQQKHHKNTLESPVKLLPELPSNWNRASYNKEAKYMAKSFYKYCLNMPQMFLKYFFKLFL